MPPHTYDGVKTIISSLGGPFLDDADVDAAANSEAGKMLLAWLQSQVPDCQEECTLAGNGSGSRSTHEEHGKAAVRNVALEKDEVPFTEQGHMDSSKDVHLDPQKISAYIPPSRSRIHANFIKEESDHVRRQIDQLTFRISKTKEASRKLLQSTKSLQRNFDTLVLQIRNAEERVAELCIKTDIAVSTTTLDVKNFFQCLGHSSAKAGEIVIPEVDDRGMASRLESASAFLLDTSNRIITTTNDLRNALNTLSTIKGTQPEKIQNLRGESIRLQTAFNCFKVEQDIDEDLHNELRDICLLLENETSTHSKSDLLATLLSEVDSEETTHGMVDVYNLHVENVIRRAWAQDQVVILKVESDVLDEGCNSLSSLLQPLRSLHKVIFTLVNCIQEGEAVVEAFVEELEDVKLPEMENDNVVVPDSKDATEIERELKRVLIENQDYRPSDAPPLLLQNQDDVLFELRALSSRLQTIEQVERDFSKALINQTSIRPLHAALPEIYANSPLNSSPALAFPTQVQQMEDIARKTAEELRGLANSLEEEYQNTYARDSCIKRLDAFVEKWTRG